MTARLGVMLRGIAAFALLCVSLDCAAQTAHPDQEPLGVGLEGFVYPYPVQARYKGKGDPSDADSFEPWTPKPLRKVAPTRP